MAERPTTAELLAAYVDGIGELPVEERRRVERHLDAEEQAATRAMIDKLRALPDETPAVDWAALERAIHAEVGDEVPRRSWLFRWRFALPALALAVGATVLLLVTRHDDTDDVSPIAFVSKPPELPSAPPVFEQVHERVTVYLDGADLEITPGTLAELDAELAALEGDAEDVEDDAAPVGFLESSDLAWIDDLDDDALARAERALAQDQLR